MTMSHSAASSELVIERMIDHFNRSAEQRKGEPFVDNRRAPSAVLELLLSEFPLPEIRAAIETCLRDTANTQWQGAATTRRQNFATDCALRMARDLPALSLTPELVQELVYKVDSVLGATLLSPLVARHLSEAQLIDALTLGVQTATSDFPRASCLGGLALYYRHVKRRSDIPTLQRSLHAFERELRRWRTHDKECLGEVKAACKSVWIIREKRSELPKPSPRSYIAYRDEQDQSVGYVIDRREDGELAIAITRFELTERSLTIEYECFDPELLPKNAPDVIELTLLQVYAADTYLTLADEVVFFDTRSKEARRRRLSRAHRLI